MSFACFSILMALQSQAAVKTVAIEFQKPLSVGLASKPLPGPWNRLSLVSVNTVEFIREDQRIEWLGLFNPNQIEVPPGVYGVRWNHMPKIEPPKPAIQVTHGPFLKARLKLSSVQFNKAIYRVSCAVFAKDGTLLGAGHHDEKLEYIRLGQMPTLFREVEIDFGASKDYASAAYAVFSISNPEVPAPPASPRVTAR